MKKKSKKAKKVVLIPDSSLVGLLAMDQSSAMIGHCTFIGDRYESSSQFVPDPPRYEFLKFFLRDTIGQFRREGLRPVVAIEDIFYGYNILTYRRLAELIGIIETTVFDCGGEIYLVNSNRALTALTGVVPSSKNPVARKEKKELIIRAASDFVGKPISEDEADSIAIAVGYLSGYGTKVG